MEQLNLFSNGGDVAYNNQQMAHYLCDFLEKYLDSENESHKKYLDSQKESLNKYNELVDKHNKNAQLESMIYVSSDSDDDFNKLVDSEMFFDNEGLNDFFICLNTLKENKRGLYNKANILDIKNIEGKRYIPLNSYVEMAYGGEVDRDKVAKVMHEFKKGKLYSSSGDLVKNRKQAIAIALSEARRDRKAYGGYASLPYEKKEYDTEIFDESGIKKFDLQDFYKYIETELKHFIKDSLGVEFKSDGTFVYKKQLYYLRPFLRQTADRKVLKEAIFSIQNRGKVIGEIIFNPNAEEKRFTASSEVLNWDNEEFKSGGNVQGVVVPKLVKKEPYNYPIRGVYKIISKDLGTFIEISGFEKEDDDNFSFYQPLYGERNEQVDNSLTIPNSKIKNISMGKPVFVESKKLGKIKIQRLGSALELNDKLKEVNYDVTKLKM
jgi:hypothetical protein